MTDDAPSTAALLGHWRTEGRVLGDDGTTVVATVVGSDVYEALGPFVVHHVDVVMGGRRTRALEVIEPWDPGRRVFPTRAYDDEGGIDTSTASVDADGTWTFRAGAAEATLRVTDAGTSMQARWTVPGPEGGRTPWMELELRRDDGPGPAAAGR